MSNSKNLLIAYRDETVGGTFPFRQVDTGIAIPQGRWFFIELHSVVDLAGVAGSAAIYLDGVKLFETTGTLNNSGAGIIDDVYFGGVLYDGVGAITFYLDDCAIDTAYIGSEGGALPKVTVLSDPELNVPVYIDDQFVGNTPITVQLATGTHTVRVEGEVTR